MKHNKTKNFTYWCIRFTPEPCHKTMQQLLSSAFNKTTVKDRLLATDQDENYVNFINYKAERESFFCADFFGYEKGRIGQVIKEAFDQEQIDPEALPAGEAKDGTKRQYLDGKLYFVCKGDHLIIAQDLHIKGRQLERYLEEMIRKRCSTYPQNQTFLLERSISQRSRKKIKGVKKIHLSGPLQYEKNTQKTDSSSSMSVPIGNRWESIKKFLSDNDVFKEFDTKGFKDAKNIEITISLSWKKKKGETVSDQIDSLANTFRHIDDELDFELETLSGKIKKNELRLSHPFSVKHINDMPDRGDIFEKMIKWYVHLAEIGDI